MSDLKYPREKPHETTAYISIKNGLIGIHLSPEHAEELKHMITMLTILPYPMTGTEVKSFPPREKNKEDAIELDIRLAEEKVDQYLQGQGPGTVRLGVALAALRRVLLKIEKEKDNAVEQREVAEGSIGQYQDRDHSGEASEAGSRNSLECRWQEHWEEREQAKGEEG